MDAFSNSQLLQKSWIGAVSESRDQCHQKKLANVYKTGQKMISLEN